MPDEWSDRRDARPQGCVLRDYTVEEVLGHGGFGIVYKARHNELDHVVAIKEYLPSELAVREGTTVCPRSADTETHFADGLRRFREEARALIGFQQNPSIVDCREFFRANGTAYLVMEYLEGLPLSEVLRQREAAGQPFTESDPLGIAIPLAEGLAHIHRAGVIHRDIKPANILVRQSDQRPVLIDFGAAKQAVAEHSRSLAPYTEGYAALEQVADGQLGPWTDLYGFGAVLWRMVAGGNPPWEPPNPVKVESRANARVREADDPLPVAKELGAGRFEDRLLEMIDGCLRLRDTERIRESGQVVQVLQESGGQSQQPAPAQRQAGRSHALDLPDPVTEGARTGSSSNGRSWKIIGVAAAISVVVALSTLALIPRDETVDKPERWGFRIEADPPPATVALLNGPGAYQPGMLLSPGQYEIEVSAPGFVTHRERVTHSESETLYRIELEALQDAVPEPVPAPSDAVADVADSEVVKAEQIPIEVSDAREPSAADPLAGRDQGGADSDGEPSGTCGEGNWADCFELGKSYRDGDGVLRDPARAVEFIGQACGGGHAEACSLLGYMYANGEGVRRDQTQAAEFYGRACESGSAEACFGLGWMYARGEGVGRDMARAAELFWQACEGGFAEGCYGLGLMYSEGEGVGRDMARAAELFGRACESGSAEACNGLGWMYSEGEGVGRDQTRAAGLLQLACEGGFAGACSNLGILYAKGEGVAKDMTQAMKLYEHACDSGIAVGCYNLLEGDGVPEDFTRAAELFQQRCDNADATGCYNLGYLYSVGEGVPRDLNRASELYQRACESDIAPGCYQFGLLYDDGDGMPLDRALATESYQRACNGDYMSGCAALAMSYYRGDGIDRDRSVARELFQRACGNGYRQACEQLEELDWQ